MCIVKMGDQSKITACNNVKIGNYIVGETLGCGTFGKVKSKSPILAPITVNIFASTHL